MTELSPKAFLNFGAYTKPIQEYEIHVGAMFVIGAIDDPDSEACVVESIIPSGEGVPRMIGMRELGNRARPFFKTDADISALEEGGLIRPLARDPRTVAGQGNRSAFNVDPAKLAWADKIAWYARKVYDHPTFAKSQSRVETIMKLVVGDKEDPAAPCAMTVLRAIHDNVAVGWFDPTATALGKKSTWKPPSQFGDKIEAEIQTCIFRILRLAKGKGTHAYGLFLRRMRSKYKAEPADLPSLKTVQRRLKDIPPYVHDYLRYDPDTAQRRHGSVIRRLLPECPLHTVEADDLRLDAEIVDDVTFMPLGRPWLIMIRDRRTGIVLGFSLVIGAPSFAGFVDALRHAWFPKDMAAYPGLSWRYFGAWKYLVVDRASHYSGGDISNAGTQLGFEIVELPPARPELKGGVESANRYINEQTAHLWPGSVMGNVVERKEHEVARVKPLLTLSETRFLLTHFFCTQANEMPKRGIGPLRTMNGVPGAIWDREIGKVPRRPLMDPDIFTRLVGNTRRLTIQPDGIQFDYIKYWSPALMRVLQHKDHVEGARYVCVRNPNNLETLVVVVPFMGEPLRVPVTAEMACYATGLRLDVHKAFLAQNNKEVTEANAASLMKRSHQASVAIAVEVKGNREHFDVAGMIDRLVHGAEIKRIGSKVITGTHSPAASQTVLDMMNPPDVPETEARSPNAPTTDRAPRSERAASIRQFVRDGDGHMTEVDRGSPPVAPILVDQKADDDEIEAEMARLEEIRKQRGLTK